MACCRRLDVSPRPTKKPARSKHIEREKTWSQTTPAAYETGNEQLDQTPLPAPGPTILFGSLPLPAKRVREVAISQSGKHGKWNQLLRSNAPPPPPPCTARGDGVNSVGSLLHSAPSV